MKLNAAARKKIPSKKFGLPGRRAYPMPDKAHAVNAKARATQQYEAGNLSKGELDTIHAKADRMLYGSDQDGDAR